uniref:Uncharacterized protein n=1 Tax=Hyaloperonospora arabidopsidis (strain Emoy2) TaxID=559515 RepID=M4BG43_HYAAE
MTIAQGENPSKGVRVALPWVRAFATQVDDRTFGTKDKTTVVIQFVLSTIQSDGISLEEASKQSKVESRICL